MTDSIRATGPTAFDLTIDRPTPADIRALRRGAIFVTVEELADTGARFRFDFNFKAFGQFEIFVGPAPGNLIDEEGLDQPTTSLSMSFVFNDTRGQHHGGRMFAMPRDLALRFVERWNRGGGQPIPATKFVIKARD